MSKMSKYICIENLETMEHKIQSIRNQNIKMDYDKILKKLVKDLDAIIKNNKSKSELNILNYIIEKHIYRINKIY